MTVNRTSTNIVTLYLDGALLSQHFVPGPATSVTNTQRLWIGETRIPAPRGELAIDEVNIFNREIGPTPSSRTSGPGTNLTVPTSSFSRS